MARGRLYGKQPPLSDIYILPELPSVHPSMERGTFHAVDERKGLLRLDGERGVIHFLEMARSGLFLSIERLTALNFV